MAISVDINAKNIRQRIGLEYSALARACAYRLIDSGCDLAQGYLYARPMPENAIAAWLRDA